jgi:mono/diheme cytochrome c family protein
MILKYIKIIMTLSVSGALYASDALTGDQAQKHDQKWPDPKEVVTHKVSETSLTEGKAIFSQCSACHLDTGVGVKGAFPPLRNRVNELSASPNGRLFLQSVVLQGMSGKISVDGVNYSGYMQSYGSALSDQQISSVLNYVAHSLVDSQLNSDVKPYTAKELAETRLVLKSTKKSSQELRGDAIQ